MSHHLQNIVESVMHLHSMLLHPFHVLSQTLDGSLRLMDRNLHVDCVGLAVHPQTAHHKLFDAHRASAVHVQKGEERIYVYDVKLEMGKKRLHLWPLQLFPEIRSVQHPSTGCIYLAKQSGQNVHVLSCAQDLAALPEFTVLRSHFHRIGNEETRDHIRDGEVHEQDEDQVECAVPETHHRQKLNDPSELSFAEEGQKERQHRYRHGSEMHTDVSHDGVREGGVVHVGLGPAHENCAED
mmetsp:Transcript_38074/g.101461  ORF Transcript_38074/g.101461 Transcript_38074/m.101461 type:complete len:239 (+) Transcript_38074:430-1146(+)